MRVPSTDIIGRISHERQGLGCRVVLCTPEGRQRDLYLAHYVKGTQFIVEYDSGVTSHKLAYWDRWFVVPITIRGKSP